MILGAVICGLVVLYLWPKIPYDHSTLLALAVLLIARVITPQDAFQGFSSPVVITIGCVLILAATLRRSGITEMIGDRLFSYIGASERLAIAFLATGSAITSSVMNNAAATALWIPAVLAYSKRSGVEPSLLLIPVSFGSILGGMLTEIGTPPNMLGSELLRQNNVPAFTFLEFTPFGMVLTAVGILILVALGPILLPRTKRSASNQKDIETLYKLQEQVVPIVVEEGAWLIGKSLSEAHFGERTDMQVIGIYRGKDLLAERMSQVPLCIGDVLLVRGDCTRFLTDIRTANLVTRWGRTGRGEQLISGWCFYLVSGARLDELKGLPAYPIATWSDVHHGWRPGTPSGDGSAQVVMIAGQPPVVTSGRVESLGRELPPYLAQGGWVLGALSPSEQDALGNGNQLLEERFGVAVVAELPEANEKKCFVVTLDEASLERAALLSSLAHSTDRVAGVLHRPTTTLSELVVPPGSAAAGRTIGDVGFRSRYGVLVLSIWRGGGALATIPSSLRLQSGDALLIQGSDADIAVASTELDLLGVRSIRGEGIIVKTAVTALLGLAILVFLPAFGIFPAPVSAFLAVVLLLSLGGMTIQDAYREIDFRVITIIAGLTTIGDAIVKDGILSHVAVLLQSLPIMGHPYWLIVVLILASSLIAQLLDNTLSVLLLGPIALEFSRVVHLPPHCLIMAVSLGASYCFQAPFSHRANLLIIGAGGYKVRDFLVIGSVLTVALVGTLVVMLPFIYQ